MSEHTKGPWKACGDDCYEGFIRQTGEGKLWIASVVHIPPKTGGQEATEANARLIAAAPELLEALKRMIEGQVSEHPHAVHPSKRFCYRCGVNSTVDVHAENCPVLIAEIAIAKAEGR